MSSPQGPRIYLERAATAETVNADLKTWRGLDRLLVRGISKVLIIATWSALVYSKERVTAKVIIEVGDQLARAGRG
jgi:hypothetical protein